MSREIVTSATDAELIVDGLMDFVAKVPMALEDGNRQLFDNPRHVFDNSGAYSPAVLDLMQQVRTLSATAGYYTLFAPPNHGGAGLGTEILLRVWDELYRKCGPQAILSYETVAHWATGPGPILTHFRSDLLATFVPDIVGGRRTFCFGMSEPDAGSDAWAMRTRATPCDGGWIVSGTKQWITNAPHASWILLFAVTDQELRATRKAGISAFFVPMDAAGVRLDSVIKLFGSVGGNEGIVSFDDVFVPDDCLVGSLHQGFAIALEGVSTGRIYNAARCIGMARWALELTVSYAQERRTFGQRLIDHQGVAFPLADCATEIYASKQMAKDCARQIDEGQRPIRDLSIVKAYATEMCCRVFDRCMQAHGGMGLTNEVGLHAGWEIARTVRIADGSGEMMRRTIAARLDKGDLMF